MSNLTRLLLLGVGGMDWAGFQDGLTSGALPSLAALSQDAALTWLAGSPVSPGPAAWASLATGVQPEVHGVWRDQEEWPGGVRPTGRSSWRVQPLWARLAAAGLTTGSVAWPAARRGADWAGVHIDERFPVSTAKVVSDWALPRGCLPDGSRDELRDHRMHVSQITGDVLAPFLEPSASFDGDEEETRTLLALGLAQAGSIQAAATWMLTETSTDAVFVHHPWLGQIRRAFSARNAPPDAVFRAAWRFLDGLLSRLVAVAGRDTLTLLVSPGWRSAEGVVLATGAGVLAGEEFDGAGLLDIAPTVLGYFSLADTSLPGRRLNCVRAAASLIPAPQSVAAPAAQTDPALAATVLALGYRLPSPPGRAWRAEGLAELATMMLERDPLEAGRVADAALAINPRNVVALRIRVRSHVALSEAEPLAALAARLIKVAPDRGWGALAHGARHVLRGERAQAAIWLKQAEADPDIGTLLTVAAVWVAASRIASAARVFQAVLAQDPLNVPAEIGMALAATARRDFLEAEARLLRAARREPGRAAIHLQLAQVYARSGRKAEAARAAGRAARLGAAPATAAAARNGRLSARTWH